MDLLNSLFSDSVGLTSVFTLVVVIVMPVVVLAYVFKSMAGKQ